MEIPNNPTPHLHYEKVEGGTTALPNLTDYTYGAEEDSRIFHAQEFDYFYEYRQYNCYKKEVNLQCIYGRSKYKCPAKRSVRPKGPNLIISKKDKKK